MKKMGFFALLVVMGLVLSSFAPAFAAETKIGYVDLAKVFDEYQKTKDFDKSLESKGAVKTAEREKLVNEIKKLRDEAEVLSPKAKEEKQGVIDEKIKTLQDFDRSTREALRKDRDGMVQGIVKEIEAVIQDFGKSQGYSYVFNDRVLIFKSESGNLTAAVIKALNDAYITKKK